MIDIHAHILPGADDGASDLQEALRMVKMAEESGVYAMVATPHANIPGAFQNYASKELLHAFQNLQQEIINAGLHVRIYGGMEIFATRDMPRFLEEGKVWTLNNTKYFLTEFDFHENPDFCNMILEDCAEAGFVPVIAHPERYFFVQRNPRIVYEWYCHGYAIQVNKGSLLGRFGESAREMSRLLLHHGLVTCVASDAHASGRRTPHMREVKEFLDRNFGQDYREMVLERNPAHILKGEATERLKPVPFGTF